MMSSRCTAICRKQNTNREGAVCITALTWPAAPTAAKNICTAIVKGVCLVSWFISNTYIHVWHLMPTPSMALSAPPLLPFLLQPTTAKSLRMATVNGCHADMIISAWHILPQSHSSEVLAPHNLLFGALTTTTLRMVSGKSQNTMTVLLPHWACPNYRAGRVNNRVNNQIEA